MKSKEEILEGMWCCKNECAGSRCPYFAESGCAGSLMLDALELVRRLQEENARLTEYVSTHEFIQGQNKPDMRIPATGEHDPVNHPDHYTQGGVECIEALKAATVGLEGIEAVCTANAIKYLWRWKQKNGAEDLRKAVWYINRLIGETEG